MTRPPVEPEARYRWEFLRRNPRYRKEYSALKNKLGKDPDQFDRENHRVWLELYVSPPQKVGKEFPGVDLEAVKDGFIQLARFKEKWSILQVADPVQNDVPDFAFRSSARSPIVEVYFPKDPIDSLVDSTEEDFEEEIEDRNHFLHLRINLSASSHEIFERIKDVLSVHQKLIAKDSTHELRNPRWAHLDQCLKIYDEVVEKKKSLEEASNTLYQEGQTPPGEDRQTLLNRLEHLLSEAKRRVEIGLEDEE